MSIIGCNINIINTQGLIIGSGDLDRLGEKHEGAILALSQKRTVIIDDVLAQSLKGVRTGINLPLQIEGEIVGVIGLTGDPMHLRQFGELVCMSAEMMLEQAHLFNEIAQNNRLKEELVLNLIQKTELSSRMIEWAKRLKIDLEIPRVAFIVEINNNQVACDNIMNELKHLQSYLLRLDNSILFAMQSFSQLVVLVPALNKYGRWEIEEHKERLNRLVKYYDNQLQLEIKTALGNYFSDGIHSIARSYQSAHMTLLIGKKRNPELQCYYYHDLLLPVLLGGLSDSWQSEEFLQYLARLKLQDKHGVLLNTLRMWFKSNLNSGETAKKLYIHRNTLDYRLKKISMIIGLNLEELDDRVFMYIALHLDKSNS